MNAWIETTYEQLPTLALLAIIALMLYTLGKGADYLIDNAVEFSEKLNIPKVVIGATIISLGTTLPEATVSVMAAFKGNPDLALGNAVGSIIANTTLILGLAAIIGTISWNKKTILPQNFFLLGSIALLIFFSLGQEFKQWMGLFMVALLIYHLWRSFKKSQKYAEEETSQNNFESEKSSSIRSLAWMALGMILVIFSSQLLIPAVDLTARRMGIPANVIAATLVAFGTSLPELTTAIKSVLKGHGELAIGNIIGANILNVLFVVGASASVTKGGLDVPPIFYSLHFPAMVIAVLTLSVLIMKKQEQLTRRHGILLFAIYLLYLSRNLSFLVT